MFHQGEAIKKQVRNHDFTQEQFAEKLGISRNHLITLFKEVKWPEKYFSKAQEILNIKITYPNGLPADNVITLSNEPEPDFKTKGNVIFVPLKAYGGFLHGYANKVFMDSLEQYNVPGLTGRHYAFEIDGMSMYNKAEEYSAKPGDMAYCSELDNLSELLKNKAYIIVTIDGICYKIFDKITDKSAFFHSLNPDYEGIELPLKSIKKAYFVSRILKKI